MVYVNGFFKLGEYKNAIFIQPINAVMPDLTSPRSFIIVFFCYLNHYAFKLKQRENHDTR